MEKQLNSNSFKIEKESGVGLRELKRRNIDARQERKVLKKKIHMEYESKPLYDVNKVLEFMDSERLRR